MNGVVERCEKTVAGRAVIPEGVTRIGKAAFKDCISLQWVRIPSTVTEIGSSAFEGCLSLQSVRIPDSVARIGEEAFADCRSLTSMAIPEGVTKIGEEAFAPRNRRRKFRGEDVRNYAYNEYIDWEGNTGWKLTSILSHKS